jgi:hypothetical protein
VNLAALSNVRLDQGLSMKGFDEDFEAVDSRELTRDAAILGYFLARMNEKRNKTEAAANWQNKDQFSSSVL